jgi:hypothetical protein
VEAVSSTDRSYCTTCGWLLPAGARATCAACGGDATPLPLADGARPLSPDDEPGLSAAKDAWTHGDHVRAITLALAAFGEPRAVTAQNGPGWVAVVGTTPVFATLDVTTSQLSLEVPVARLPQTKRVAALRAALALCNETSAATRFCLRLDLVVARFTSRIDHFPPAPLRRMTREIAAAAGRAQQQLAAAFDARPAIPDQGASSSWDRLGRPQSLPGLAPVSAAAPPSALHPESSRPSARPSSRPSSSNAIPAMPVRPITLRLSIPPALAAEEEDDDMPAVLAGFMAEDASSAPASPAAHAGPSTPPPPSRPVEPPVSSRPSVLPSALASTPQLGVRPPFASSALRAAPPPPLVPAPLSASPLAPPPLPASPSPERGSEAPPSRRAVRPPAQEPTTAETKLCELMRQALALATALSFQEKPHTMLLLVRAAVFRAVHEHHDTAPNAVSYLVRATRPVTREIWSSRAEPGRTMGPIPVAEPALGALEQVVTVRAHFPREKPAAVEPWTSAPQAKENLARYLTEIELAPPDPVLRHYLALGALCELLSRTRLPAQTEQRLREIVAYAQRDGSKPQVVELMMTALRKIVSG